MQHNSGIGSLIARRAASTPARIALCFGERSYSYRELDLRVTRLARGLAGRGVGEGDRVAYLGHNRPAALETLFACGLLGAIAVPLHPGFDGDALARVLADAAPRALIGEPELVRAAQRAAAGCGIEHWFATGLVSAEAERYRDLLDEGCDEPVDRPIGLDHTCLLAFSSGTTGPNKGVRLTHGNLVWNAINTLCSIDYVADDVHLVSAPLYRMGGLGFALTVLMKGGTCVLQARAGAARSLELIARHRVTALFDAVGALEALAALPAFAEADLSSLRLCVTGGSVVPPALVEAFARRGLCLQPGYGLTEAAPLALLVDRGEVAAHPGAAGRPPLWCAVRVVDGELEDVPPGAIGELLVRGPNVTPGYWRAPEADARALVDGWLRTGDAARAGDDGMIAVVGRVADALVLDGRSVHPGPAEAALRAEPEVADCAVVQDGPGRPPRAYLAAAAPIGPARLRQLAELGRAHLGAACPLELRVVAELPRNPNGKVLRHRLTEDSETSVSLPDRRLGDLGQPANASP